MDCLICGKEFEILKVRGFKPKYCSIECKKIAMKNSRKKYVEKMKMIKKLEKEPRMVQMPTPTSNVVVLDKIISRKSDVELEDNSKVIELSRNASALRFECVEEITRLRALLSGCDKKEQKLLHEIESYQEYTRETNDRIGVELHENRTIRRNYKCKIEILETIIRNMPNNPNKFAYDSLKKQEKLDETYNSIVTTKEN